ncbi:transcription factor Cph1p [[Candida] jaroonii]|uniref:Transcription factor Cph1p n=1 Tax=[Candida] jaroonii TaxID=467808 RepID=A0ACA9Y8W5_9ASCO|nr:transcription factor Cph1p [[Candida] jaroonii]
MSDDQTELIKSKLASINITDDIKESLRLIEDLKFFLDTAPANWQKNQVIRRYYLNHDEGFVSCIFWNNLYFITGTDIVRCIVYKFQHFGRKILDRKKFEEGIFSDLRNLKCGTDAILEPPKSEFLNFLYKNSCLRTQKKQKVFFWFNVPHDKLMADALERDIKKAKSGQQPTTIPDREPSVSFDFSEEQLLYHELVGQGLLKPGGSANDTTDDANTTTSTTLSSNNADDQTHDQTEASEQTINADDKVNKTESKKSDKKDKPKKKDKVKFEKPASSPEYTTTNLNKLDDNFAFLNQETPDKFKNDSDEDEDDFPLDYFEENSNDYITIDPSISNHPFFEEYPPYSTNQVVVNDEFLIEQTLPLKTPLPVPFSAKFPTSSNPDEYYNFPPLSGRYQSFPRMDQPLSTGQPFPMLQPLSANQPFYPFTPSQYQHFPSSTPTQPFHPTQGQNQTASSQSANQGQNASSSTQVGSSSEESSTQRTVTQPSSSQSATQGQPSQGQNQGQLPPVQEYWPYDPSMVNQPVMVMNENYEPVYQVMNPHAFYPPYPQPPQISAPPPQHQSSHQSTSSVSNIPSVTGPPTTTQTITIPSHGPMAATSSPYATSFGGYPYIMSPNFQGPSQRQQAISATMMMKKRQMFKPPPLASPSGTIAGPSTTTSSAGPSTSTSSDPLQISGKRVSKPKSKKPRDLKDSVTKALEPHSKKD